MPRWPKRNPRSGVDEYGRSPLWYAAAAGDVAGIDSALAAGADPTAGDDVGYTSLHVAAQNGHIHAVRALLRAGANANATDQHGNGPLWVAVHYGCLASRTEDRLDIIALLLESGAKPDQVNKSGRSPKEMATLRDKAVAALFSR